MQIFNANVADNFSAIADLHVVNQGYLNILANPMEYPLGHGPQPGKAAAIVEAGNA